MCSCDSGTPCQAHAGTRWDDAYHLPQNDVLGFDPYNTEPEQASPAEYEVLDG